MLHQFISQHRNEILTRCLDELKAAYPEFSDEELINDIPEFVDEIILALRNDTVPGTLPNGACPVDVATAPSHGVARKQQGFDLPRLIHDYGLVCEAVSETATQYGERPSPREYQILNRCIDAGLALAVESYAHETRADEQSERAKDLGILAHEIRNAVSNALLGFQLIRKGRASTTGMTADVVQRALTRIATLVADTLSAAQVVNGVVANRVIVDVSKIFSHATQDVSRERGVKVCVETNGNLYVDADSRLLSSAVGNLLQNAMKFTRENETITLRAFNSNDKLCIEVEDRCGGLPEGSVDELFQPFVRKSADQRGAGLGLGIARRAIEAHGGTLSVRNLPGVGCVFVILIPRIAVSATNS